MRASRGGPQGHRVLPTLRHGAVGRGGGARVRTRRGPQRLPAVPDRGGDDRDLIGASLAVWTTTPWTLPSNTGAAVAADADYVVLASGDERTIVAAPLAGALGEGWSEVRHVAGRDLVGARYEPPYPNVEDAHTVVAADYVSLEDGTGIVHIAPAFGPEDLAIGRAQGWPVWRPVADDGTFTDQAPAFVRGIFVKDADPAIIEDL